MKRCINLKYWSCLEFLFFLSCSSEGYKPEGKVSESMEARQIILIMTDTQRWDMLSCVTSAIKTPNMDRLASEGVRFDRAYTVSPVSGPARSAIFTGTYPHSNGSWGNDMPLANTIKTVGERLSDNGFHCAYIGKWHLDGSDYFGNGICPEGWDQAYWYDMRKYLEELTTEERILSRLPETNKNNIPAEFTFGHRITQKAIHFLETHKRDEPFFVTVSYDEPHHPFLCPEPFASMYEKYEWPKVPSHYDNLENKPFYQQLWAEGRQYENKDSLKITHPYFFGSLSFIDSEIGRLLDKIDQLYPNALVIFTSDHGDFLEAHSLKAKGPCVYDDVARVPFIVRWRDSIPRSEVSQVPISLISITPSILEAAGVTIPDVIEGKSILSVFKDPHKNVAEPVFMEFGRFEVDHDGFGAFQPLRAVFDGRYKLSINLMSSDELYDIENDPYEVDNLIEKDSFSNIRNSLHDLILEHMNETRDPFRGIYWNSRPWRKDFNETWEYTEFTRARKDDIYYPRALDYNTGLEVNEYFWKKVQDKKK